MKCLYCAIAQGAEGAHVLQQDAFTACFLDPSPEAEGHIVIVPKEHVDDIFNCDEKTWEHVMQAARSAALLMNTELGVDSITMFHSSGPHAQQKIPHLAIHLIPRKSGDELEKLSKHA
jgi:histidine triad (HIT) family protein